MYTHDIILEEVTAAKFDQMKKYWNLTRFNTREDSVQAKILNPLAWPILSDRTETYFEFMKFLLDNRWLDQICVNDHGRWIKRYSRKIDVAEAKNLAFIAANSHLKRNYFDIKFKEPRLENLVNRPCIEFREHEFSPGDTRIVGYQVTVPDGYTHLFNVTLEETDFFQIQGLWVPEEGMRVTVKATR